MDFSRFLVFFDTNKLNVCDCFGERDRQGRIFGLEIEKMVVMKASFAKWPNGKLGET